MIYFTKQNLSLLFPTLFFCRAKCFLWKQNILQTNKSQTPLKIKIL